jgi:hypothetical protein
MKHFAERPTDDGQRGHCDQNHQDEPTKNGCHTGQPYNETVHTIPAF